MKTNDNSGFFKVAIKYLCTGTFYKCPLATDDPLGKVGPTVFTVDPTVAPSQIHSIGSLSNGDGNGKENVTQKCIFISFVLLRDYFNSLNFYKNGELSRNQIGRSGVQVKKENDKFTVVRSRSPQNLKCGHFTLLSCRGRQRNVPNCKTQVQSDYFCSLNLLFCGVVVA